MDRIREEEFRTTEQVEDHPTASLGFVSTTAEDSRWEGWEDVRRRGGKKRMECGKSRGVEHVPTVSASLSPAPGRDMQGNEGGFPIRDWSTTTSPSRRGSAQTRLGWLGEETLFAVLAVSIGIWHQKQQGRRGARGCMKRAFGGQAQSSDRFKPRMRQYPSQSSPLLVVAAQIDQIDGPATTQGLRGSAAPISFPIQRLLPL